mgnify:CR=1 FL=1
MFRIVPVVQYKDNFDGMLYKNKEDIGGIGKDDEGIYINLRRRLTVQEHIDLLKMVNGLQMDFFQLEVEFTYVSQEKD